MKNFVIILSLVILPISCFASPGTYFGKHDQDTGALISFKVFRKNISGADFSLTLPGLCIYDDQSIEENTFSFGGGDFPDLLIDRNLKINTEFEVESDSGHVGVLKINCSFKKVNGKLNRAKCAIDFYSPERPVEQLDHCTAEQVIKGIRRGMNVPQ